VLTLEELAGLHCPCCGHGLEAEGADGDSLPGYGVVRCGCYRYPVVDGILVLRQLSRPSDAVDPVVARLDDGDRAGALRAALELGTPVARRRRRPLRERLRRAGARVLSPFLSPPTDAVERAPATFAAAVAAGRDQRYRDYLFFRHANPSALAAMPLVLALAGRPAPAGPVLDLACGAGHSTFLLSSLLGRDRVVAADHDFVNLHLARRFHAGGATCLCLDAELPLPFADARLGGVFCNDAFHYVRSKVALVAELERVVARRGPWLLPHLHNAGRENPNPGLPLTAEDYLRCFERQEPRLFDEARILADFAAEGVLDLQGAAAPRDETPVLTLVAGRDHTLFTRHHGLVDRLLARPGLLRLNPIFTADRRGPEVRLKLCWPDRELQGECEGVARYLPPQVEVDADLVDALDRAEPTGEARLQADRLVRSFVLVAVPAAYGTRGDAGRTG
jgi:SAM-dependent methyltransferase